MALNGGTERKLPSWVEQFVEHTEGIETPAIFRKWAGIVAIAAALEQKVWITTSSEMFPNLYVTMIAPPGLGKTRVISEVGRLLQELPDPHIAPTSINSSSLVDQLKECKRVIINPPNAPLEYNSMLVMADELGTFMHEYDDSLIAVLSSFYNVNLPYGQRRRGNNQFKVEIARPQLNMLLGSTPSNLLNFMPESAWTQGFASRIIFVYSDTKKIVDDFAGKTREKPADLIHDLKIINGLIGKFHVTEEYANAVNNWRQLGETTKSAPKPTHPKLLHYCTRRKEHLYRLSMIASIDKSNALVLTKDDFNRAMSWLAEVEIDMGEIFKNQSDASDGSVMEEIVHYIGSKGVVKEQQVINEMRKRVPGYAVLRNLEVMERSGMIHVASKDRMGIRSYKVGEG